MDQNPLTARRRFAATFSVSSRHRFLHHTIALATAFASLSRPHSVAQDVVPAPEKSDPPPAAETTPATSAGDLPGDEAILNRLPELSTEYVRDLLGIYARLNNANMIAALTAELRKRDPDGALPMTDAEIAREAMDLNDDPPGPHEALENRIDALILAGKYPEVIVLMEKERAGQFAGKDFPFEVELGDAYGTTGNLAAAREAYQRVVSSKSAPESSKALARAGIVEIDKLEAIAAGYQMIEKHRDAEALAHADALRRKYPEDLEVQLLYAQALVPNYHYMEALPMLEAIKAKHYKGQAYPAQDALAESLRAVGRLDDSAAAYAELAKDSTVPAHVREQAVIAGREVSQMRAAHVAANLEFLSENEGDARMATAQASAPLGDGMHGGFRGWAYDVDLTNERSLRRDGGDFLGAVAFVRKYLDDNLSYVEARVGGGEHSELTWGVSYGREATHIGVLGYELSVDGNIPAIDSLQLIALNGVENRVSGSVTLPLPGRFEASAGVFGRTVEADGADLGDGWGASLEVGRPIWENVTQTRQIYLSYQANYESFDAARISEAEVARLGYNGLPAEGRLLGADLIEPSYHPHGLSLSYEAQLGSRLYAYAGTGLYFDFSDDEWDYHFTAGVDYSLTDTIDLIIEGGYYSDGTGASNDDSEVFVGTIGVKTYY